MMRTMPPLFARPPSPVGPYPVPGAPALRERLRTPWPALHRVEGPAGSGKTMLLREALSGRGGVLHWVVPPLEEEGLLADLDRVAGEVLGPLPAVERPDLLPLPGTGRGWALRIEGVLRALGARAASEKAPSGVLVVDGAESLLGARTRLGEELQALWTRHRDAGGTTHLVLAYRGRAHPAWEEAAGGEAPFRPGAVPFREAAARALPGTADPRVRLDAWAIFGDHPGGLPPVPPDPEASLEDEVVRRILTPGGDLHDAPLRRLEGSLQAPRRYLGILRAMAGGADRWGEIARGAGAEAGNQVAPYLARLEEEGWIEFREPLDGRPGGRRRRYVLRDPFSAFWFGHVLPWRSLLAREDPRQLFRERIVPGLPEHRARWLPELALRWLTAHAPERLPAPVREVGGLWAGEVEILPAARLGNGQIVYGGCDAGPDPGTPLLDGVLARMREVRWGIGREARGPILFVLDPPSDALRRRVAVDPLARLLTPTELMEAP
jgi:uncharacterized protein